MYTSNIIKGYTNLLQSPHQHILQVGIHRQPDQQGSTCRRKIHLWSVVYRGWRATLVSRRSSKHIKTHIHWVFLPMSCWWHLWKNTSLIHHDVPLIGLSGSKKRRKKGQHGHDNIWVATARGWWSLIRQNCGMVTIWTKDVPLVGQMHYGLS